MSNIVYSTDTNLYEEYEKRSHSQHDRRCIDNTVTGSNKCVGYCRFSEHPGFLTSALQQEHNCIEKQCHYYLSKPAKANPSKHNYRDLSQEILCLSHRIMIDNEYVRVIKIKNIEFNRYIAFYITITNDIELEPYRKQICKELDVVIDFVKLNYDFDKCIALLYTS